MHAENANADGADEGWNRAASSKLIECRQDTTYSEKYVVQKPHFSPKLKAMIETHPADVGVRGRALQPAEVREAT